MMRPLVLVVLLALVRVPEARAEASRPSEVVGVPEPTREHLGSGLELVLDPVPGRREVAVLVSYRVGMGYHPLGLSGLPHLVEHLLYRGSRNVPDGAFAEWLGRIGSSEYQGQTRPDEIACWEVVPSEQLAMALFLESDRMAFPVPALDERLLASERAIVLREEAEARLDSPFGDLRQTISETLYPEGHPYREGFQRPEELGSIEPAHVRSFLQRYVEPANATLVVSGGFDPAVARALVERWFGGIRASAPVPREPRPPAVSLAGEHRVVVAAAIGTNSVWVVWPTPAFGAPGDAELDVISDLLADRLRERLVDAGIASAVYAYQASARYGSEMQVGVDLRGDPRYEEALAIVDQEIAALRDHADPGVIARMREASVDLVLMRLDDLGARATLLATWFADEPYTFARDLARYRAVDARSVRQTIERYLRPGARLVIEQRLDEDAPPGGRLVLHEVIGGRR